MEGLVAEAVVEIGVGGSTFFGNLTRRKVQL